MKSRPIQAMLVAALVLLGLQSAFAASKAELQARFKARYPQIRQYKNEGKIGETATGILEVVEAKYLDDATLRTLIGAENADRGELYRLIAEETNTTPETVARNNATRNFKRAHAGDWLKYPDGQWRQKT